VRNNVHVDETNMENKDSAWGTWLQAQLDLRQWRQADLVKNSDGAIKRDRVSKWINGIDRPSYRAAVIVANTLGINQRPALEAAGFMETEEAARTRQERVEAFVQAQQRKPGARLRKALRGYSDLDLLDEMMRRARLRDLGADALPTVGSTTDTRFTDATPIDDDEDVEIQAALTGERSDLALAASDRPDIEGEQERYEEQ
jgi:hypothetical protein